MGVADGLSWTSSIAIPLPLQNLASPDYREFTEVWPAAGGWDAAVRTADSPDPIGKELLHSADGLTWSRLAVPPTLAGALHVSGRGGAAVADRRVMWQVWDAKYPGPTSTLATSTDGRTWTSLDEFQGKGATVGHALAPDAGTTGPWLLAGDVYMGGSCSAVIWSSLNLTTWQAATLTVPGAVSLTAPSSLTRWSGGYITVAKWSSNGQAASTNYATWVSTDGATWSAGPALPPTGADGQAFLAVGPNGLLAVRQEDGPTLVFLGP